MGFWNRQKKEVEAEAEREEEVSAPSPAPERPKRRSPAQKRKITPLEVKLVAIRAVEAGLLIREVAELADVSTTSVRIPDDGDHQFRVKPITDSGRWRSTIPGQADHRFRRIAITDSGPSRSVAGAPG